MDSGEIVWPPIVSWTKGWRFRAAAWTWQDSVGGGCSFTALDELGDVAPGDHNSTWSLHIAPQFDVELCTVRLLGNGFSISSYEPEGFIHALVPEPGVLWGESNLPILPSIFSPDEEVRITDDEARLETSYGAVLLRVRQENAVTQFCLVKNTKDYAELRKVADRYLDLPLPACISDEIEHRAAFWSKRSCEAEGAQLISTALEALVQMLRSPAHPFTYRWSASGSQGREVFDLNELFPLVLAWCEVDPEVAEELVCSALSVQREDGLFPAQFHVNENKSADVPAVPLIAQSALCIWRTHPTPEFLSYAVSALARYVPAVLGHYDPGNRGLSRWVSSGQPLTPETFTPSVASADLTVLLLCEVDAFLELCEAAGADAPSTERVVFAREELAGSLTGFFWNRRKRVFRDRIPGGEHLERANFSSWIPIIWEALEPRYREAVLRSLREVIEASGNQGVPVWEPWQGDATSSPLYSLHQLLLINALGRSEYSPEHHLLAAVCWRSLRRLQQDELGWPADLRTRRKGLKRGATANDGTVAATTLALALILPPSADEAEGDAIVTSPILAFLESHRVALVSCAVAFLSLAVIMVSLAYSQKKQFNYATARAIHGLASHHYEKGRYADAAAAYRELLVSGHEAPSTLIRYANACFHLGDLEEAEKCYLQLIKKGMDSPIPLFNLALTLYRQDRLREAAQCYAKAAQVYSSTYPRLGEKARVALYLVNERARILAMQASANGNLGNPGRTEEPRKGGARQGGRGEEPHG